MKFEKNTYYLVSEKGFQKINATEAEKYLEKKIGNLNESFKHAELGDLERNTFYPRGRCMLELLKKYFEKLFKDTILLETFSLKEFSPQIFLKERKESTPISAFEPEVGEGKLEIHPIIYVQLKDLPKVKEFILNTIRKMKKVAEDFKIDLDCIIEINDKVYKEFKEKLSEIYKIWGPFIIRNQDHFSMHFYSMGYLFAEINVYEEKNLWISVLKYASLDDILKLIVAHSEKRAGEFRVYPTFPLWISPIQVTIFPRSEESYEKSRRISEILKKIKVRVSIDTSEGSIKRRIERIANLRIPYGVIVDKEEHKGITVIDLRKSSEVYLEKKRMELENFIKTISQELNGYPSLDF